MITRCPSCHTHFRVRAEQLAARAGQVRCGKCAAVFDALAHLSEEAVPVRAPGSTTGLEPDAVDIERASQPAASQTQSTAGEGQGPPSADIAKSLAKPAEAVVETPPAARAERAIGEATRFDTGVAGGTSSFSFGPAVTAAPAAPGRGWLWLSGSLLLLLVLLAQAAYQYRGAIVLLFPETKPYAVALCASLGCELPLPRRIELLSIEASDLQADTTNPNVMVLSATLKNRAIFNQQHPLLELTLTDARDQPVVRRVLAPQDYLGKAVDTGFGANTEIAIKVFIEGSQVKATGYRLYLFYP